MNENEIKVDVMNENVSDDITSIDLPPVEEEGDSKVSKGAVVIVGGIVVGAAVCAVVYAKAKDKLKAHKTEKMIKKLEKEGYVVCKEEEADSETDFEEDETEE